MAEHPGYWMHETSGVLHHAVCAYLSGDPMTEEQVAALRAYLRQWIYAPVWAGDDDEVAVLRARIDLLTTPEAITSWLDDAEAMGIDPL